MSAPRSRYQSAVLWLLTLAATVLFIAQLAAGGRGDNNSRYEAIRETIADAAARRNEPQYTVFIAPYCKSCADLWSILLRAQRARPLSSVGVSVRVSAMADSNLQVESSLWLECARIEGRFWNYAEVLMGLPVQSAYSEDIARRASIRNVADHRACVADRRLLYELEAREQRLLAFGAPMLPVIVRAQDGREDILKVDDFMEWLGAQVDTPGTN